VYNWSLKIVNVVSITASPLVEVKETNKKNKKTKKIKKQKQNKKIKKTPRASYPKLGINIIGLLWILRSLVVVITRKEESGVGREGLME